MKALIYSISILLLIILLSMSVKAQPAVDLEAGAVFTGYNDVRIPGDKGTLFSMKDDLVPDPTFSYRLRLDYTIASRHTISLLYAALLVKSEGSLAEPLMFQDVAFPANTKLQGDYKFNSYRLTYRYDFIKNTNIELGAGFTAKITDAKIAISSGELNSEKTNVGFVPIINFRLLWNFADPIGLLLYGDALVAPQGRAEDILLALTYNLTDQLRVRAGYRILEGGADNDEVYNFSMFNYASVGVNYTFWE